MRCISCKEYSYGRFIIDGVRSDICPDCLKARATRFEQDWREQNEIKQAISKY